jgi:hypothetical protein
LEEAVEFEDAILDALAGRKAGHMHAEVIQ